MTLTKLALCLLAGTIPCSTGAVAQPRPEHVPRPGYVCRVGEPAWSGIRAHRLLDESGQQIEAEMRWRRNTGRADPEIFITSRIAGAEELDPQEAQASITWLPDFDSAPARGQGPLRLELTSAPARRDWRLVPFAGPYENERSPGITTPSMIRAHWADLLAFARGADRLHVVLRDREGAVAGEAPFDPAIFTSAATEIAATLARLRMISADFRSRCEFQDDLYPEEIVVG